MNIFKNKLQKGNILYGPFWKINSQALVEVAAYSGWDFAIFDMEHGPHSPQTIEDLVRTANGFNLNSIIRVPQNEENAIVKALDTGADCVLVPHVSLPEEAFSVVRAGKFHPLGQRGMDVYARAAKYGHIPKSKYIEKANNKTVLGIQIEGKEGVNNLTEILKIGGIDLIFIGPYDLSESMGVPGETTNPKVISQIKKIVKEIKCVGKYMGIYVDSIDEAHLWAKLGVQFISFSVDTRIFYQASYNLVMQLKK